MKKLFIGLFFIGLFGVITSNSYAKNNIYVVRCETGAVTDPGCPNIKRASVKVKDIRIWTSSTTQSQTLTFYVGTSSGTETLSAVFSIPVPITSTTNGGVFSVFGNLIQTSPMGDVDYVDLPYFTVKTSPAATVWPVTVEVIYGD